MMTYSQKYMKIFAILGILLGAFVVSVDIRAQETNSVSGAASDDRPAMPRLFYTNEQRRILEVVRQEFITQENIEFSEFTPLLIEQQETLDIEEVAGRQYDLRVDAYIHNHKSGSSVLWLNKDQYALKKDGAGSSLSQERLNEIELSTDGTLSGVDEANKSRFFIKVGQKLTGDGEINETYPIVIIKKK